MAINFIEDVQVVGSLSISGDGSNSATLTESASGDFTIHAQDDLRLNANGHDIVLQGASNEFGRLTNSSQNFVIQNTVQDKDIIFKGNDGGSTIDALTLDMSDGGNATFAGNVLPTADAAQTIGGSSKRWNFGYFNNSISVTDGNINAGTEFDFNQGANFEGDISVGPKSDATVQVSESGNSTVKMLAGSVGRVGTYSSHNLNLMANSNTVLTLDTSQNATFAANVTTTGLTVSSSGNTLATFTSTDDTAKFTLADDDTTAYFGVKDSILNIGLNSSVSSNENLEIKLDGSKQYMGFGGAPSTTDRFKLKHSVSTNDDVNYTNFKSDFDVSGSTAVSADRTYRGIHSDLDSTSTSGDTTDEVRLYGIESNVVDNGDADLLYGVYSFARNNRTTAGDNVTNVVAGRFQTQTSNTAGTVTNSKGVHGSAQADNAGGTMTQMYGGHFEATQTADSDKVIGNVYGVFGKVDTTTGGGGGMFTNTDGGRFEVEMEVNGATMTNARAVHGILDINDGTVTNGYQFYGSSAIAAGGAITNHYGIYSIGASKNYLAGTLQLGSYGSGSQTGTSAYYLIADSSGNIIEKTPAEVRADIGAGTGSGTVSGSGQDNRLAIWSGTSTIDSTNDFRVDATNLYVPNLYSASGVVAAVSMSIGTTSSATLNMIRSSANYINTTDASGYLVFRTAGYNTALTLDTGQNAQFAGQVNVAETLKIGGATSGTKTLIFESTTNAQDYNIDFYSNAGAVQGRINYAEGTGSINLLPDSSATAALSLAYDGSATFAGEVTLNGTDGHINLDGNNAVIFDNSNNNNAWYIRNGGSNAATLQMGTGSSPGSNIKLTLDGSGNATFAGTISATVNADDATYTGIVTVDSGTLKYRTKSEILADIGAGTGNGTVTEVTVGTGLDVSNGTTTPNITLDLTELSNASGAMTNNDRFIIDGSSGSSFKMTPSLIPLSIMNNDAGFTTNTGTVTGTASTNQIAYWSSSSGITGESGLTYSASQDKLIFSGDYAIRDNNGTFELNTDASDINTKINGFGGSGSLNIGENTVYTAASGFYVPSGYGISAGTTATASGTIRATGNIIAYYSDERLKNFQGNIPNALDKVCQLNGYYYKQNKKASDLGFDNEERQVGVSAQEVEKVLPEVIETAPISYNTDEDYLTVDYGRLVPLLIESIKELKNEIEILKNK